MRCEIGDCARLEQDARRQLTSELRGDADEHLKREQRMAAHIEKVIADADRPSQNRAPDIHQVLLQRVVR